MKWSFLFFAMLFKHLLAISILQWIQPLAIPKLIWRLHDNQVNWGNRQYHSRLRLKSDVWWNMIEWQANTFVFPRKISNFLRYIMNDITFNNIIPLKARANSGWLENHSLHNFFWSTLSFLYSFYYWSSLNPHFLK